MKDFTLKKYAEYLKAIKSNGIPFFTYRDFMLNKDLREFSLVRHDVDRKPKRALDMARLENELGVVATYYFRTKPVSFKPDIIREIESLGHEIGYHYECLSDTNGDINKAIELFKKELEKLSNIVEISTCSMHGRPLKPYDNRDIWRSKQNHNILTNELKLIGEIYLDIDYSEIAYINDTGRNWTSGKSNVRDKVNSNVNADFDNDKMLLSFFREGKHKKIVFQIHPERWTNNPVAWAKQQFLDWGINQAKNLLNS